MELSRENQQLSLIIPIPNELDSLKIIGRPKFLQIQENPTQNEIRTIEVTCNAPEHFASFESFCDLVEKNVREKHLPALSVFINILRVWNWDENRKIA
jgi:hypothetical protein